MNKDIEISMLIDFYGEILKPKQLEIIDCYYNKDLSLSEISANIGITRQGVLESIKRSESLLYEMESKLNMVKRFTILSDGIEKIKKLAYSIKNDGAGVTNESIVKNASEILGISEKLHNCLS